jgi:FAD synthase
MSISKSKKSLCDEQNKPIIEIQGLVVKGFGRGRQLSFPTANLKFETDYLTSLSAKIGFGVYAGMVLVGEGGYYLAGINYGKTPTFEGIRATFEVHILDFQKNLYDQKLSVWIYQKLREVQKFEDADQLKKQLDIDIQKVREYFKFLG